MRFNISDTEMTADQEFLFQQKTRERTGKFFWAAVFFVLLFQIYNISYTLYYTHFRLGSRASKIYMCMYVGMLLVCAAAILIGALWTRSKHEKPARLLCLYAVFGFILLLWSSCITLYDQRVSENLSIYMTTSIYLAGLIYMKPKFSIPFFISCEAFLLTGLLWMHLSGIKDTYGVIVNSIGLTIVALYTSLYRWNTMRQDFLNHLEIEQKNRQIMEQSEKLNYVANHDALTGLWNRNYLNEWKENFWSSNGEGQVAVFIVDIDYFKRYNDAFGHVAGDECLKKVASSLEELDGKFFRFGGEEFLCLFDGATKSSAQTLADAICRQIEQLHITTVQPDRDLTVSVGYSVGTMPDDAAFRRLLHEADEALYRAKDCGRNRAVRYSAWDN